MFSVDEIFTIKFMAHAIFICVLQARPIQEAFLILRILYTPE